jgi:hypothetical protein
LYGRGSRGDRAAAAEAQRHLGNALAIRRSIGAPEGIANAAYLGAATERVLAQMAATEQERLEHLSRAAALLHESDRAIAALLVTYEEPAAEAADLARMAIHAPWRKVYDLAIDVFAVDLHDYAAAFEWSERWRRRALAMNLGALDPTVPGDLPPDLVEEERAARELLRRASSFEEVAHARQELSGVWKRLAKFPAAAEYVALRSGAAVAYDELTAFLRSYSQSPMST